MRAESLGVKADRRDLLAHLCLAAAIAVLAWPLLGGRVLYYGDLTLQFIPWRTFARAELLHGRLPLWLPDTYLGLPFLGNDQSAVLYPWHWLCLPFSPARQIALGCLVHLQLAASGMYCFARARGRSRRAALIAGLALGLGGFCVSKQQFPSLADTIAWLPWLAWSAQQVTARPGLRGMLPAVLVVGLQWLAGHAQMSVMGLGLVTGWQVFRPAGRGARGRWLAAVGWGTALAAAQLLPTFELLGWSARTGFSLADAARFNVPPWQLLQLALPACFGHPAGPLPYFGVGPFWETTWYVGLVALPLACAGAVRHRAWFVVAFASVVLAFGIYSPVYPLVVKLLPALAMFRDPARFTLYASFALALLAADGYDEQGGVARRAAGVLAGVAVLGWLCTLALPTSLWQAAAEWLLAQSPSKSVGDVALLAAGWRSELGTQLLLAAVVTGLVAGLLGGEARKLLPGLLAVELIAHGLGLNPSLPAAVFATDPRPEAIRDQALIWVPPADLEAVATHCFNLAHYPSPPRVAEARASLAGNVLLGTGTRQVAGYDPLRPAAMLAWIEGLEALPVAERRDRLAAFGCAGEWSAGQWTPSLEARSAVRRGSTDGSATWLSPQRVVIRAAAGSDALEWTHDALPGWQSDSALELQREAPGVQLRGAGDGPDTVRLWYAPSCVRSGFFVSLLALGGWVLAAVAVTERSGLG